VALSNLGYRGTRRSTRDGTNLCPWPTAHLSDITVVTGNPRGHLLNGALMEFKKHLHVSKITHLTAATALGYTAMGMEVN